MTVRVVLVDDQEMIRAGFRMVLEAREDLDVVGEAEDGDAAVELLERLEADVVLMDIRMPRMSGVEATRRIRAREEAPKVLVLTTFDLDEYAYDALRAGASGFLLKDTPVEDLATAIGHVHRGDAVVAPSTTRRLLQHVARTRSPAEEAAEPRRDATASDSTVDPHSTADAGAAPSGAGGVADGLEALTPREREVLLRVAHGLSNREIADEFVLAEGTVKVHVGRIFTKLGLRDRVQAVVLAYESGLVRPGDER